MKIKARIEFEITPIRHFSIQCPKCGKWFVGDSIKISGTAIHDAVDAEFSIYCCPLCQYEFSPNAYTQGYYGETYDGLEIEEPGGAAEVYKDILAKSEEWK